MHNLKYFSWSIGFTVFGLIGGYLVGGWPAVFIALGALLFGLLGYFAGTLGQWLQRKPRVGPWLDRIACSIFIALGLRHRKAQECTGLAEIFTPRARSSLSTVS